VDDLLAADRAFSEQAASDADPLAAFGAMLTEDVIFPNVRQGHVRGKAAVLEMLRANPNYGGPATWRPIRGGVSADGSHGFTLGYFDMAAGDPARRGRRYLAYWVKRPEGWRVAAYRQLIRGPGEKLIDALPPSLPARTSPLLPAVADSAASVRAAEQAFSDRAQQAGLRAAFTEFGRPDSINMTAPTGFAVGNQAIGANMPDAPPSPVRWSADHALAAPSGDLAITFGYIHSNGPVPAGQPDRLPFFTIWRRDAPDQPWRYIAE
jgi:ketosteroid isomerase-like protein